ncbi:Hypothetical protein R9X50_00800500 [Acrodontium crateriforme]|uniref:Enoyl reductase (ER) domain-containing protein n=1 Tax=Acrodontium crateriforme TaxID=150365 RepID=A0AAQ3MB68_9PEZI|nr:Hypothetical protein R9X50_00800500 [Acrodontium crateriforme]
MPQTHKAAVIPQKGNPLTIIERTTPTPGLNEVLIQIKAIAVNPVDYYMRDFGVMIPSYPALIGNDAAGIIVQLGDRVTAFKEGDRVLGFISGFYHNSSLDHGAFQEFALAAVEGLAHLPDEMSFEHGCILPLATLTALSSWTSLGIPLTTKFSPCDNQAVLIWGGASSVGSIAIQFAKMMGYTVYTTARTHNHAYIESLGADAVFDYTSGSVVEQIALRAKTDGVALNVAHCVVSDSLQPTLDVMKLVNGSGKGVKVSHAPVLPAIHPILEGVEVVFTSPPAEKGARDEHIRMCFHEYLKQGLESGAVVPSPRVRVVE